MFLTGNWGAWANTQGNLDNPETGIRMIVKGNAEMALRTFETPLSADEDTLSYNSDGRKYIGWKGVKQAFEEEFPMASGLTKEIDYTQVGKEADGSVKKPWPLRDSGVLDRREHIWMLVNGHESMQEPGKPLVVERVAMPTEAQVNPVEIDLTGEWEIQEEDKAYQATLDANGNGPYTWQEGRIQTEKVVDRIWSGTWHQKGNDREGGFEVLLSEDGKTAEGVWWYLRVGTHKNIPPRLEGGTYKIKRLSPQPRKGMAP